MRLGRLSSESCDKIGCEGPDLILSALLMSTFLMKNIVEEIAVKLLVDKPSTF
jgi:hypothetical protein